VYRTLELLEELGLVTHAHLSHGAPTFHPVGESLHVHLVCQACGGGSELPSGVLSPLAQALGSEHGLLLRLGHVALFHICAGTTVAELRVTEIEPGSRDGGAVAHYGDPMREQRILDTGAGLVDRSHRGVLAIPGPERLTWLHSITTQHFTDLRPGQGTELLI